MVLARGVRMAIKRAAKTTAKRAEVKQAAVKKTSKKGTAKKTSKKASSKKTSSKKTATRKSASLAEYNAKRDFSRTKEPAGKVPARAGKALHFVIQKHDASHLHYDFRLELDGVMKSWAVPKGPSLDPSVRRLAMEVEDHPISYNAFEGTIPQGEYGGGTVMLWDRGSYDAADGGGAASLREGYERGNLEFVLHGERLEGAWVLVRMQRPGRPQWLLIKRHDGDEDADRDVTAEIDTSVVTGRTMDEIEAGRGGKRVWRSNR
jgi:bifunctional non-homologous end joining protein LigD